MKKFKKFPYIIIIEGFSGSGKSAVAKSLHYYLKKNLGYTVVLDGDDIRKFMKSSKFKMGYTKIERGKKAALPVSKLINIFLNNNINVIYPNVGLNSSATKVWYKNFKNIIYIHILTKIDDIVKFNKKDLYRKFNKNIVGIDIKPDFNKKADIVIKNDFTNSIASLKMEIIKQLDKILKNKKIK